MLVTSKHLCNSIIYSCITFQDAGYCFTVNEETRYFRGGLLLWTGDTLGSNYVAGFKEGVGGTLRFCRHCMGTREESQATVCFHCSVL